jgi:hypothetical protein
MYFVILAMRKAGVMRSLLATIRLHGSGTFLVLMCACALLLLVGGGLAAAAEGQPPSRRVALVIGNGAYEHASSLPNPPKDARDMAAKLTEMGYEVVLGIDLTMKDFGQTLRKFSRQVEGADVGLLFYAGHGLQVDGANYLIPVDAQLETNSDLEFQAVKLDSLLGTIEKAAKVSIVFLDACRNNPMARSFTRGVASSGLAPQEIASGSYIAYDGHGSNNSPFTAALLKNIDRPNVDIRLMMADVRADVFEATQQKQLPWENNSLIGRFYFREGASPETSDDLNAKVMAERQAFEKARAAGSADALEAFLADHPDGVFASIAQDTLKEMKKSVETKTASATLDDIFWRTIRDSVMVEDFRLYLESFERGAYRDLAEARIDVLERAASIKGHVMEDGQTLDSKEKIRQAALQKIDKLPVVFIQYGLVALGFPISDFNGIMDSQTRKAIRGYQASVGETQTGALTPRQTLDVILAAAAVGDEHAETAVGVMVASGIGLDRDDELARMWLNRAADRGNKYAQANLAILYRDGRGGEQDVEKARSLLQAAVEQGLDDARPLLRDLGG